MATVWKMSCFVLLQVLFLSTVTAQINLKIIPLSQIKNEPYGQQTYGQQSYGQQPLISSLLSPSTTMPFGDKLSAIANIVQKLPARPGRATNNKRHYMAEALRQSALESLMVAANACKCCHKAEGPMSLPKSPMTIGADVIGNRAVKVKYM